jgi:UDP-2-acetamido-3-amino-2,3-dideoxy-glucuronate N-acetyltransferase
MNRSLSIALVGAGYWGKKLLPKFLAAADCSVKAVIDLHQDNRAYVNQNFPGIPTSASLGEALEGSDIDGLIIATPPATHFALAMKALAAGKHVWIEKPLALRFEEGQALVRQARAKGVVLFVDHTFLYDGAIRAIRDLIANGELGRLYHVFSHRLNLGRIKRDSNVWWNSAPHDVSILLYLHGGQPAAISVHGYRYLQPHIEDLNIAAVEMADGVSAFIHHNWLYPENTAKLTVIGSKKLLTYEGKFDKRDLVVYDYAVEYEPDDAASDPALPTTIPSRMVQERKIEGILAGEPLVLAINDFLESARTGCAPLSDGDFSLKVLAVLEAGERSLRANGSKIPILF